MCKMRMTGCSCVGTIVVSLKELSHNYLGRFLEIGEKFLSGKFGVLATV
jgi:hypothetical protein